MKVVAAVAFFALAGGAFAIDPEGKSDSVRAAATIDAQTETGKRDGVATTTPPGVVAVAAGIRKTGLAGPDQDTTDRSYWFLRAYNALQKGEKEGANGSVLPALRYLRGALRDLDAVGSWWPDWNPSIIKLLRQRATKEINRLGETGDTFADVDGKVELRKKSVREATEADLRKGWRFYLLNFESHAPSPVEVGRKPEASMTGQRK